MKRRPQDLDAAQLGAKGLGAKKRGVEGGAGGGAGAPPSVIPKRIRDDADDDEEEDEGGAGEELVFEDPFGDDIAEEEFSGDEDEGGEDEEDMEDDEEDEDEDDEGGKAKALKDVWRPDIDTLGEGEELEMDPEAYVMYHAMQVEWPCLSFDIVPDRLGAARTKFPLSCTVVAGTQADKPGNNRLCVMRFGQLHRTQDDGKSEDSSSDEDDDEDDDDESTDDDPTLEVQRIPHAGCVNRVRTMPQEPHIVATWSETGKVHLWDIRPQLKALDALEGKGVAPPMPKSGPVFTFGGHSTEGYAVDWSPVSPGRLATGDCHGNIHVWNCDTAEAARAVASGGMPAGVWSVDAKAPYKAHTDSVEDLQWSPNEATVFASASVDKTVRIWDSRVTAKSMLTVAAHDCDVNVISWSRLVSYLLVSGGDDGSFKIWDLRNIKAGAPVAHFRWHKKAITSVEWAPDDENVIAVGSADDTVTLWDMSLENDDEAEMAMYGSKGGAAAAGGAGGPATHVPSTRDPRLADVPPQLLFIHGGQKDVKEAHFHKQLPGVVISTAGDGFNVWKPDVVVTN